MRITLLFLTLLLILFNMSYAQTSGYALQYDGVDDFVNFGDATAFEVGGEVTYEAWVKPDSSSQGFIFNKWVGFLEDKYLIYSYGRVSFYLFNAFGGTNLPTNPNVPLNQYTHIAATYDGSFAKLYVNGVLDTSLSIGSNVLNSNGNLYTGSNPDRSGATNPFGGIIDEFRIWDIARGEAEIQSTMYQELTGNEAGLVGYWNFNEGTGSTTADQTNNGNDGTISGAVWVVSGAPLPINEELNLPLDYQLYQNYPNPFNPSTTIKYQIQELSHVLILVYDVLGREVATLVNEEKHAGNYELEFKATGLQSGVYFYKLQAGNFIQTKKMVLIK